jgi:hypothetical protein
MMELYSQAQAPGLSSLSLVLNRRSGIHSFCSMFILPFCGLKKLDPVATFISRRNCKKMMGAQKNTTWKIIFALASFAASSQCWRLLLVAVTV